jgi:hypothetical protein
MAYIQRFIGWCIGVIILITAVTLVYFALTHPDTTSQFITTVLGAIWAAGKGAAEIVINIVTWFGGLFS